MSQKIHIFAINKDEKMKIVKLLAIVVLPFGIWQCSTYKTVKIDSNKTSKEREGVVYSLPQTALKVNVTVVKEIKVKGPFAEYAEKLLGLKNVIAFNQTGYRISDISIEPINVPDTSLQFLITKRKPLFRKRNDFYELNSSGEIESINCKSNGKETTLLPESMSLTNVNVNYPNFFQLYADASQIEKIDTVYEIVKMDTVTMSKPIITRTLVTKTVEQRAVEAADYILKFRMKRYELIAASQEIPYSKETMEYMNDQLLKMESDYLGLFMGISQFENHEKSFVVLPNTENINKPISLFDFSDVNGIISSTDPSSSKFTVTIEPVLAVVTDTIPAKRLKQIPYRNPMLSNVYVNVDGQRLPTVFQIPIHQFGVVRYFPKGVKSIKIDPQSGLVTRIKVK